MQRMSNTHRQSALQLTRDKLRRKHVAALHDRMMRKQADPAARFIHREFDERSDRAVVGNRGVVAADRRDEYTLTIESAVNGLDWCRIGVGIGLARAVKQRQAVDRQT